MHLKAGKEVKKLKELLGESSAQCALLAVQLAVQGAQGSAP